MTFTDIMQYVGDHPLACWGALIGTWGGITGTVALIYTRKSHQLNRMVVQRDATKIEVDAVTDFHILGCNQRGQQRIAFQVTARNVGRRPLSLGTVVILKGGEPLQNKLVIRGEWGPNDRLEEGERATLFHAFEDPTFDPRTIVEVQVCDQAGGDWTGRHWVVGEDSLKA